MITHELGKERVLAPIHTSLIVVNERLFGVDDIRSVGVHDLHILLHFDDWLLAERRAWWTHLSPTVSQVSTFKLTIRISKETFALLHKDILDPTSIPFRPIAGISPRSRD